MESSGRSCISTTRERSAGPSHSPAYPPLPGLIDRKKLIFFLDKFLAAAYSTQSWNGSGGYGWPFIRANLVPVTVYGRGASQGEPCPATTPAGVLSANSRPTWGPSFLRLYLIRRRARTATDLQGPLYAAGGQPYRATPDRRRSGGPRWCITGSRHMNPAQQKQRRSDRSDAEYIVLFPVDGYKGPIPFSSAVGHQHYQITITLTQSQGG